MASKHAVLGLVIERPDYGYGLFKRLEERCGPWAWSRPSVYTALEELSRANLVSVIGQAKRSCEAEGSGEKQGRAIYRATPWGVTFFEEWMFGPDALEAPRQELELKLAMARTHELPRLIDMTLVQEQTCVERLATLSREARRAPSAMPLSLPDVAARLVRDTEVQQLRLHVEWLQQARETMKPLLDRRPGAPLRLVSPA
jgi:DNA-binding PadR family transcriptional regulator